MSRRFSVGLDFGTDSARALLVEVDTAAEVDSTVHRYQHGVLEHTMPSGDPLPPRWALQHPQDYLDALADLLAWSACQSARLGGEVLAIGVSFTSCTVLPTTTTGTPLAMLPRFENNPHAYAKLWKHHAAEPYARRITRDRPSFLERYDWHTSSEWSLAKAWQTMVEAPEVWAAADRWIDAGDWLVWQLVGHERRSASQAGYKNHWQPSGGGYPSHAALDALHPGLSGWRDKLDGPYPLASRAGTLTGTWARRVELSDKIPVAVAAVDSAAAVPGTDVRGEGVLVVVLGTSTCHLSLSRHAHPAPGVESVVAGGAVPGFYDYSTGQSATGDMLGWLVRTLAWAGAREDALFDRLNRGLTSLPGPTGVSVLDWWNGCRTPLADATLTGRIEGLKTTTSPLQIYAAMLESAAYGTRLALELHERVNGTITEIRATGGLAQQPAIMQRYADVLGRQVRASTTRHGSARGAACYGAVAAGVELPQTLRFNDYEPEDAERYQPAYQRYRDSTEMAQQSSED